MYESVKTAIPQRRFKLDGHESAYCHLAISEDGFEVCLISYETCVCSLERKASGWYFHCDGTYSRSTIKHISWFLEEFYTNISYYEVRDELTKAKKRNKQRDKYFDSQDRDFKRSHRPYYEEYITICVGNHGDMDTATDRRVKWYLENGKKWTKYSKTPDYEKRYYGYSNYEAINLP